MINLLKQKTKVLIAANTNRKYTVHCSFNHPNYILTLYKATPETKTGGSS